MKPEMKMFKSLPLYVLTSLFVFGCASGILNLTEVKWVERMNWLGVFLLPLGSDASPSQGYPQHLIGQFPFTHLEGGKSVLNTHLFIKEANFIYN